MEGGIKAGDPLIEIICSELDTYMLDYHLTSLSGAKKGDGDIHIKCGNIAIDGKYTYDPPRHPKFSLDDILKITKQANNHNKHGAIVTNTQNGNYICMELSTFMEMLSEFNDKD